MASYVCPFCNHTIPEHDTTHRVKQSSFSSGYLDREHFIEIEYFKCPNCLEISSIAYCLGEKIPYRIVPLYPASFAKQFPEYVPEPIRQDYEEAYSILSLSPKASATLSRRCLQGMIRDFWNISKRTLNDEITALKDEVHPTQWKAIDALRKLGNIGAHMERDTNVIVDIDPGEAEKLLKLIELLIEDWYIRRHEQEQLYEDIIAIDDDKQSQRAQQPTT